jgi:hypothetical protein
MIIYGAETPLPMIIYAKTTGKTGLRVAHT